jgi:hypothetical protein
MPDLSRYRYAPAVQDQTDRLQSLATSSTAPVLMLSRMSSPDMQRVASLVANKMSPSVVEQASCSVVKGTSFPLMNQTPSLTAKRLPFLITKRTHPKIITPGQNRITHPQCEVSSTSPTQDKHGASSQSMPSLITELTLDWTDSQKRADKNKRKKQRRENRAKVYSVCTA